MTESNYHNLTFDDFISGKVFTDANEPKRPTGSNYTPPKKKRKKKGAKKR